MTESDLNNGLAKAKAFFVRAEEVASTENFDYTIDLYMEGLRKAPDALHEGHLALRAMALLRQGKGGKKPSVRDKMKRHGGRTPLDEMLNGEYLLAKDPDHVPYAEAMLRGCVAGCYTKTGAWIAQLVFEANRNSEKPSFATYILLKEAYDAMEMYENAVTVCQYAIQLKPQDAQLRDQLRDLTAQMTVKKGKYDYNGNFRDSILDRESQEDLQSQDHMIKSTDYRKKIFERAQKVFLEDPDSPINILNLAETTFDMDAEDAYLEAEKLLQDAYDKKNDFTFKKALGEMKIRKLKNEIRKAKDACDARPDDEVLKNNLDDLLKQFGAAELDHYRLCVENYPTNLRMKYEYGIRLLVNQQYDMALPLFQDAQKDPRYKITAMDKTGLCFFMKGWFLDAIDIFKQALDICQVKDSSTAKELRYNLARSYEEQAQNELALEYYRKLAQLDYNFKDVRQRVDNLRNKKTD